MIRKRKHEMSCSVPNNTTENNANSVWVVCVSTCYVCMLFRKAQGISLDNSYTVSRGLFLSIIV